MNYYYLEEIDSTNKFAKEKIDSFDDKTIVYTYNQTAGRGRFSRNWNNTGFDNIYASIILKPASKMEEKFSNLTQYLCVILAQTLEEYGVKPKIKWPNDIRINYKKISGILAEAVIEGSNLKGIVLGVGINLNSTKEKMKEINQSATALNIEIGHIINKEDFSQKLFDKFFLLYDKFIEEGFPLIREEYIKRAEFLGKEIAVKVFDNCITGVAEEVTANGELKIVDKENKERTLTIGDIL